MKKKPLHIQNKMIQTSTVYKLTIDDGAALRARLTAQHR
jgi:hypothetical protein